MLKISQSRARLRTLSATVFVALALPSICIIAEAQSDDRSVADDQFQPKKMMSPRKALVDAPFIAANEVKDQVGDTELILGVVIQGQARAYPINMLTGPSREIINDRIGETDFAATW
jgi:hypothetical protein